MPSACLYVLAALVQLCDHRLKCRTMLKVERTLTGNLLMQGFKFVSKGVRRVIGRIRVSYGQRERLSTAFRGTGLARRFKQNRSNRHQA